MANNKSIKPKNKKEHSGIWLDTLNQQKPIPCLYIATKDSFSTIVRYNN